MVRVWRVFQLGQIMFGSNDVYLRHACSVWVSMLGRCNIVMPCQTMSMVVVHVASGTRDILVFWAAWPRLWATLYKYLDSRRWGSLVMRISLGCRNQVGRFRAVEFYVLPRQAPGPVAWPISDQSLREESEVCGGLLLSKLYETKPGFPRTIYQTEYSTEALRNQPEPMSTRSAVASNPSCFIS
jgi:hypothetical protein